MKQWCPGSAYTREVHWMRDYQEVKVTMTSFIDGSSSLDEQGYQIDYPHANPTRFKVNDLLMIAGVVSPGDVAERGAILSTTIRWQCSSTSTSECQRGIESTRMDQSESGFSQISD